MARKKVVADPVLRDWSAVDDALRDIRECHHSLQEQKVAQERRIDAIKDECSKQALPLQNRIKRLEADVREYVSLHRAELVGKSRKLNFGVVGYRLTTKLVIPTAAVKNVISKLKGMGYTQYVKTTETLDRDALKKCSEDVILEAGAYLQRTDDFYYDVSDSGVMGQ